MNTEYIKLFVRIAALESISQAGKEFSLSPAVSGSYLNKLEEELGVKLVYRTTRQISLTEEGKAFLPHAYSILDRIEMARNAISCDKEKPQGTLRVTAPAPLGRLHLLEIIGEFIETYPEVDVDLFLSDTIHNVVEGGYDIAIRNSPLNDSSLIAKKLANDKRILCASPSYLEKFGRPAGVKDLDKHKFVNHTGLETWTLLGPDGKEYVYKTKNRFRADNGEAARDAAVLGLGMTLCSVWGCQRELEKGQLIPVLSDYTVVSHTAIYAVYPSKRYLSSKIRIFLDFLAERFDQKDFI